ncbi:unnamed protein product [Enterobius vermicularis]|uniref:CS domain-containing protein n=1 Tax=Enterobius vermicularis TaxID=51028 RepID=A0A0N4VBM7_ENTVE|nr:unnamed protein product [Enterobius vermicularis]
MITYDFYQTEDKVIITILKKGLESSQCKVAYDDATLTVYAGDEIIFDTELLYPVMADNIQLKCSNSMVQFLITWGSSTVEVTLKKIIAQHWETLERKKPVEMKKKNLLAQMGVNSALNTTRLSLAKEAEEDEEKAEGENSVNKLFQASFCNCQLTSKLYLSFGRDTTSFLIYWNFVFPMKKIYAESSDDVKKAMLKSYTESAGTVLSTNWNDIKSKKTEIKPPEGMEFKKW